MAIDTNNEKLAIMEWGSEWEPGLPMDSTSFPTQAHKQQLILGLAEPLWTTPGGIAIPIAAFHYNHHLRSMA